MHHFHNLESWTIQLWEIGIIDEERTNDQEKKHMVMAGTTAKLSGQKTALPATQ